MLQRSTQIGEFYRMKPPEVWNVMKGLPPHYMDILIFDEESDRHVRITFEAALKASNAKEGFFRDRRQRTADNVSAGVAGRRWTTPRARTHHRQNVLDAVNGANVDTLVEMASKGVWLPMPVELSSRGRLSST